jgi:hypothetical protein
MSSLRHISDPAGVNFDEVICEICDGFLLFRNRDASTKGLPVNPLATAVYIKYALRPGPVNGRVFLAHPDHVPSYWRRKLHTGTEHWSELHDEAGS